VPSSLTLTKTRDFRRGLTGPTVPHSPFRLASSAGSDGRRHPHQQEAVLQLLLSYDSLQR
jgi:hypothetical protein